MDAPKLRYSLIALSLLVSTGASYQSPNFIVTAPTQEIAERVGEAAETYRRDLAKFWLDQPLPNWSRPCRLRVRTGTMGAGGETKFQFVGREVLNWNMYVQGSLDRILDSVLPHEVNHTIFACHFRKPLPRWADEGAATLFEHRSEQLKQLNLLNQVINGGRDFISLRNLLTMKEYPKGYRPMLIMYAEGYALADFLVQQGGRKRYLRFLVDGEKIGWTQAIKANYHHGGVDALQKNWRSWVLAGMPKLKSSSIALVADADRGGKPGGIRPAILDEYAVASTIRSQSPDTDHGKPAAAELSGQSRSALPARSRIVADAGNHSPSRQPQTPETPPRRGSSFEAPRPRTAQDRLSTPRPKPKNRKVTSPLSNNPNRQPVRPPRSAAPVDSLFFGAEAATSRRHAAYEPTHMTLQSVNELTGRPRKHLPQERKLVTGSIPQWAGFPGQKELF